MALILLRSSLIKLIKGNLLFWNCIQQPGKGTKKPPTSVKSGAFGAVCGKSLSASSSLAFPWGFRDLFWEFWGFCSTRGRTRNIPKSQPSDVSSARFQPQNPGFIPVYLSRFIPGLFRFIQVFSRFIPVYLSWFIIMVYPGFFLFFSRFTQIYLSWFIPGFIRVYPGLFLPVHPPQLHQAPFVDIFILFILVLSRFIPVFSDVSRFYRGFIPVYSDVSWFNPGSLMFLGCPLSPLWAQRVPMVTCHTRTRLSV